MSRLYFAYNIKAIHHQTGWNLKRFAKALEISGRQVENWENGTSLPTLVAAIRICKRFRLNLHNLCFTKW